MLELYYSHQVPRGCEVIADAEAAFLRTKVENTELNAKLMSDIDQAQYVNAAEFVDRFGRTLPISELSTGCKTALVIVCNSDKVVDLKECGHNARDAIIRNIRNGKVLFTFDDITIDYPGFCDFEIDVLIDGEHYTSLDALNLYLTQGM